MAGGQEDGVAVAGAYVEIHRCGGTEWEVRDRHGEEEIGGRYLPIL